MEKLRWNPLTTVTTESTTIKTKLQIKKMKAKVGTHFSRDGGGHGRGHDLDGLNPTLLPFLV